MEKAKSALEWGGERGHPSCESRLTSIWSDHSQESLANRRRRGKQLTAQTVTAAAGAPSRLDRDRHQAWDGAHHEGRRQRRSPLPDFLAAYLDSPDDLPSRARYQAYWESAEPRLQAAREDLEQRAKEGQVLPRSIGITCARARLPQSLEAPQQGLVYRRGRLEALGKPQEPPVL